MKSILITGASSGIGHATALEFLSAGWCVGLLARRQERLNEITNSHKSAIALPCDITDPDATERAFAQFTQQAGRLDALFNNAGTFGPSAPIDKVPLAEFDRVVNVNLRGMFIAARLAFAQMRAQTPQGGRIINNGSLSAHVPRQGSICYTTTKHAITGMTRTLSLDGRPYDIACGQIDIGNALSEMVSDLKADQPDMQVMDTAHAARSVLHMAELPLDANVQFMTVMATKMPYIGRG